MKTLKYIAFIIIVALALTSCMNAAVTGVRLAYDRYAITNGFTDRKIEGHAQFILKYNKKIRANSNVDVYVFHRVVLLTGIAKSNYTRNTIIKLIRKIPDTRYVINDIHIGRPKKQKLQLKDIWITTKIKSNIIFAGIAEPTNIKIITVNGVVYLIGIAHKQEARKLIALARKTNDVKRVVAIFDYIVSPFPKQRIKRYERTVYTKPKKHR